MTLEEANELEAMAKQALQISNLPNTNHNKRSREGEEEEEEEEGNGVVYGLKSILYDPANGTLREVRSDEGNNYPSLMFIVNCVCNNCIQQHINRFIKEREEAMFLKELDNMNPSTTTPDELDEFLNGFNI